MKVRRSLCSQDSRKFKDHIAQPGFKDLSEAKVVPLWVFIAELLGTENNEDCVRWTYRTPYEFVVANPQKLAVMWGKIRKNPKMTYTNLCRAIRYYYRKDIIEKVVQKTYTYRFIRSQVTEPLLARCFPDHFDVNCPLMKEPEYVRIHRYVSNNNDLATDASIEDEELGRYPRPRLGSCTSNDSSSSGFEDYSDSSSVCSGPGFTLELTLKDRLLTYQQQLKKRLPDRQVSGFQPPDQNMFWMVNASNS